jgi:hypothetical protein
VPERSLSYHVEMLPQLEAQETRRLIDVLRFVSGRMKEDEQRTYIAEVNRALNGGETPRAPRASLAQLRELGIEVVMEGG